MTAALNRTSLISEGPVTALGPVGTIDSGSMEMRQDTSEDGTYLLVFKDGVKLLYKPSK
jgi:lipopolysaccharide export system protein LptC